MKKIRYAVVGAGWISQEAFMPGVAQTGNSEMVAIVTGNREKGEKLAAFYDIPHIVPYADYDRFLASGAVDAVYVALPNDQHADFTIRAAKAGVHALVEKPLASSIAESEAMIDAAAKAGTLLMTAYRLHNEPGTVAVLEAIRRGEIGDPRFFTSIFSYQSAPNNHRLMAQHWGGPLPDIGVYCLNAARHVFASEPTEAQGMFGAGNRDPRFAGVGEMISATLRFPNGRIAHFIASFGAEAINIYRVVGTEGEIEVSPGFHFQMPIKVRLTKGGKTSETVYPQLDHFSGQTAYFSDCILKGERPEADGEEGLADMRAMLAIEASARSGKPEPIVSPPRARHPDASMVKQFPATTRRLLV
jgi:predicted dehydrogenase